MRIYFLKIIVTAVLVVLISEIGKRNAIMAAVYASLPLTTLLAILWLYLETQDIGKVTSLSWNVLLAVAPSHVFLIALPLLIKVQINFWLAMIIAISLTIAAYYAYVLILKHFHISF